MAIPAAIKARQDELVELARRYGEILSECAFGEQGPDLKVTLADLEEFLRPLNMAVAGGFLALSAEGQTERFAESLPCPTCGRPCSRSNRDRTLQTEQGPFTWSEPRCHCEHCERSFFPSADRSEDRSA